MERVMAARLEQSIHLGHIAQLFEAAPKVTPRLWLALYDTNITLQLLRYDTILAIPWALHVSHFSMPTLFFSSYI